MMRAAQIDAALSGCSLFTLLDRMVAHATLRPRLKKAAPPKPPSRSVGRYVAPVEHHVALYNAFKERQRQQSMSKDGWYVAPVDGWTGEMRGVPLAFSTQVMASSSPSVMDFSQCSTRIEILDCVTSSGVYD
jgi:hypothetical protein